MEILKGHKRTRLFAAIGGVVVVLVAGLISVATVTGESDDRDKFSAAVADLAGQPMARYKAALAGAELDIEATADGTAFGNLLFAGRRIELMSIGGKSYLRVPDQLLSTVVPKQSPTDLRGKWITGTDGPLGAAMGDVMSPPELAARIRTALDRTTEFPHLEEPVDGTPALKVTTLDGDLFITENAPHRVLRFGDAASAPAIPPLPPMPRLPTMPPGAPALPGMPSRPGGGGAGTGVRQPGKVRMDLSYPGKSRVIGVYEKLVAEVGNLEVAIDAGVLFEVDANARFTDCEALSCTVAVKAKATSPAGRVVGPVTADVRLDMTIDGVPAGECRTTGQLPATGAGTISCVHDDLEWTAIYTLMEAAKKVKPITFIQAKGELQARALIKPDVERIKDRVREELAERRRGGEECIGLASPAGEPCHDPCPPGTPVNQFFPAAIEPASVGGKVFEDGRAIGGAVCLTAVRRPSGPRPEEPHDKISGMVKGHLVAAMFWGSRMIDNVVAMYSRANNPGMLHNVETTVRDHVDAREKVWYRVIAHYPDPHTPVPDSVLIEVDGSHGLSCRITVANTPEGTPSSKCK
ncbi:DNA/RNA non-specific endonuclease [Amycolatopsis sp. lyj-90]|uniref:DNA/RNA non-specific endonuclease n=1 Tax=Amycolatopsis sp. lyj-90 TaxID=2789285 RepID=UPI00397AD2BF